MIQSQLCYRTQHLKYLTDGDVAESTDRSLNFSTVLLSR